MSSESLAGIFSKRVRMWSSRAGASMESQGLAEKAAYALTQAMLEGHTCVQLNRDQESQLSLSALLESGVVGTPVEPGSYPLILDSEQRLYLHRYFDYEWRLAKRWMKASSFIEDSDGDEDRKVSLDTYFKAPIPLSDVEVDWQKCAAALALIQRFVLVSGGPGTGKTTMVVNLLAALLSQKPDTRIVLAAPTGKAAARMLDALRKRASELPEAIRSCLPSSASTVHRLLGFNPRGRGFIHDAKHPLMLDVLVVDEASMLDLSLATHLLEAVPPHARVIFLGDKDQLAAVESGAVFAELSSQNGLSPRTIERLAVMMGVDPVKLDHLSIDSTQQAVVSDSVVWFTKQHRFSEDSAIGRIAHALREGDENAVLAMLKDPSSGKLGLQWRMTEKDSYRPSDEVFSMFYEGFAEYWSAVRGANYRDIEKILDIFDRFRVLCAVKRGPWGAESIAQKIEEQARAELLPPDKSGFESAWYPGRPVMILRNDPQLRLFNGDIGITLVGQRGELQVCFPRMENEERCYAPVRLPMHETAYAMTIHKSQGSELDHVAVVFPKQSPSVITRELLYTGLTRARKTVVLISSEDTLRHAIHSPTRRSSGLLARLTEISARSEL